MGYRRNREDPRRDSVFLGSRAGQQSDFLGLGAKIGHRIAPDDRGGES